MFKPTLKGAWTAVVAFAVFALLLSGNPIATVQAAFANVANLPAQVGPIGRWGEPKFSNGALSDQADQNWAEYLRQRTNLVELEKLWLAFRHKLEVQKQCTELLQAAADASRVLYGVSCISSKN